MNKILNYIQNGRGLGVKVLLILTLIISVYVSVIVKTGGTDLIPYAQQIADQILPVKVENGVIVNPVDTVRTATLGDSGFRLPFVLDTTTDTLDTSKLSQGVYISRTTLYTVNNNEVRIKKLQGSFELPQQDYTDFFNSVLNWIAVISFIIVMVFGFLSYFITCLIYSWCAILVAKLTKNSYSFDQRMRLSVVCFVTTEIIFIPLTFLDISSKMLFFIIVITLQGFFLSKLPLSEAQAAEAAEETAPQPEIKD